ncbi:hypothetical protein GJ496_005197 [Pomphorhynchus laevis]|nr:hypothetical protein GJ496_005197 [Pomphorhynchus laevis]KAI0985633.1 hypothetical protein GJ496_005197 [Pomphorhynchus laevis]
MLILHIIQTFLIIVSSQGDDYELDIYNRVQKWAEKIKLFHLDPEVCLKSNSKQMAETLILARTLHFPRNASITFTQLTELKLLVLLDRTSNVLYFLNKQGFVTSKHDCSPHRPWRISTRMYNKNMIILDKDQKTILRYQITQNSKNNHYTVSLKNAVKLATNETIVFIHMTIFGPAAVTNNLITTFRFDIDTGKLLQKVEIENNLPPGELRFVGFVNDKYQHNVRFGSAALYEFKHESKHLLALIFFTQRLLIRWICSIDWEGESHEDMEIFELTHSYKLWIPVTKRPAIAVSSKWIFREAGSKKHFTSIKNNNYTLNKT